jgi:LysM repeat protein
MPRNLILAALLLLTACGKATPDISTPSHADLIPYLTSTASPTLAQAPEVVFGDTPLPTATPFTYIVKAGDTLGAIADQFRVPLNALMAANPNVSPNAMSVGTKLLIPADVNNPSGEPTATPAPFAITQVQCYPTADGGLWCFALARNDSGSALDNLSSRISLLGPDGTLVTAQTAITPINRIPPRSSMPLTAFFPPTVPADVTPRVQVLTAFALADNDPRYLPVTLIGLATTIAADGRTARISGQASLSETASPAKTVWVAAVAYDSAGRVSGFRRWEWSGTLETLGSIPFDFTVSGFGNDMARVEVFVEARP